MLEKVIPAKCNISIAQERYNDISTYIESAEAFSRNMFRPVMIIDLFKKNYLYVSHNFSHLLGNMGSLDDSLENGQQIIPSFAREDEHTLSIIFNKAYDLFLASPIAERKDLVFSFSFHTLNNGKKTIVHQCLTPLSLTDDGDLWLVLCTTSFSSRKTPGSFIMKSHNEQEYEEYNIEKDRWYHKEGLVLSLMEKDILLLSSQGYTMKEIASILFKSEDTIKMYKRVMFSKLCVRSITEAVFTAINLNLI